MNSLLSLYTIVSKDAMLLNSCDSLILRNMGVLLMNMSKCGALINFNSELDFVSESDSHALNP